MSSMRPRVFMSAPTERESFQFIPVKRAARLTPPNFPVTATAITSRHIMKSWYVAMLPICVLRPVNAKNKGSKATNVISSNFSLMMRRKFVSDGMMIPARNAPNKACMPMASVRKDEINRNVNISAITFLLIFSL